MMAADRRQARQGARRWYWQRLSGALMLIFILVHLIVILLAASRGFTAADVLARTQASVVWAGFYGLFVVLACSHAAIGLRNVLVESGCAARLAAPLSNVIGLVLLLMGWRAVWAVTFGVGA